MSYLTVSQYLVYRDQRVADQLSNDANGTTANSTIQEAALSWASAMIDHILSAGSPVTLTDLDASTQEEYKMWTARGADLFLRRRKDLSAKEFREEVSALRDEIGEHVGVQIVGSQSMPHTAATYNRFFGGGLQGYIPASDGAEVDL